MNKQEILNFIPPMMSSIAAVGAAVAAFFSLQISSRANSLSEKSILAVHHNSIALEISKVIDTISTSTEELSHISYELWESWSRDIELKDTRNKGGINPRPLRHVLTNGSKMLVRHSVLRERGLRKAQYSMFSIIRNGMGYVSDDEYQHLLEMADNTYTDFEGTFGLPSKSKNINESKAFRWVYYQLVKRIDKKDLTDIWQSAWLENGWIIRYQSEYIKIKPSIEQAITKLKDEKNKVEHSVLPLTTNPILNEKYEKILDALEALSENSSLEIMESYQNWEFDEEICLLIIYCMGVSYMTYNILESFGYDVDWRNV